MKTKLQELAKMINGTVLSSPETEIAGATNIEEAGERQITFAVEAHLEKAAKSNAAAVIIPAGIKEYAKPAISVDNPRAAFAKVLAYFYIPPAVARVIHPSVVTGDNVTIGKNVAIMANVVIADNVSIGDNAVIYPNTYIGQECKIGADCLLYPNVTLRENTVLGDRVIIHSGTVIGSDGFGFVTVGGIHHKVPQVGNVIVEDDVEIGANATLDRATTGSTIVRRGTKIDNLVHLAHNVVIGEACLLSAQTGIAGSAKVGSRVTFAGQSGSAGHLTIGDNCVFAARAAAISDVPANSFYAGFPGRPHRDWLRQEGVINRLPELLKKVRDLEKRLSDIENGDRA